jgi:hypothetical protein
LQTKAEKKFIHAMLCASLLLGACGTSSDSGSPVGDETRTNVSSCGTAPAAPTGFTATITARRNTSIRLSWVAPATFWNGAVSSYLIRYATVPITATNFDDSAVTSVFTYSGTPAAPTQADGVTISGLNIETDYYFAVKAVDVIGNVGDIAATTTATRATFNVTVLSGVGTDNSGFDLDGSADLGTSTSLSFTGDGLSDLIVGATGAKHVYVYFGTASGYSTTPSITITGAVNGFGRSVANVGDIDGDGLADLAVSSPNDSGGKVYIYSRKSPAGSWGSTTNWPSTLTDTQASYVISTPGTVTGVIAGRGLQRLGDFDGDGSDDFAISYSGSTSNTGAVIVVKGGASFASLTPNTTNSILINGGVAGGVFGGSLVGIGKFYGSMSGATMLVGASVVGTSYSFTGVSPVGGVATIASADDSTVGVAADRYGLPLGYLGPLGSSPGAVTVAALTGKYVDLHLGTTSTGPFRGTAGSAPSPSVHFVDTASGNSFGVVSFGSGVKGTSTAGSFIGGDSVPDLVLAGQSEVGRPFYLISGGALTTLSGTVDVSQAQSGNVPGILKVANKFPTDWSNGFTTGCSIVDLDGDGNSDFAIGEFASAIPGRVVVFY